MPRCCTLFKQSSPPPLTERPWERAGCSVRRPTRPRLAGEFLRANFRTDNTAGFWGARNLVPTVNVTLGTTKTIKIDAKADVPLLFARIFGRSTAQVTATATATKKDTRLCW